MYAAFPPHMTATANYPAYHHGPYHGGYPQQPQPQAQVSVRVGPAPSAPSPVKRHEPYATHESPMSPYAMPADAGHDSLSGSMSGRSSSAGNATEQGEYVPHHGAPQLSSPQLSSPHLQAQPPMPPHYGAHYPQHGLIFEGNAHHTAAHTVGHAPVHPAQQPRMRPQAPAPYHDARASLQDANRLMLPAAERRKLRRAANRRAQRARKREAKVVAHEEEKLRLAAEAHHVMASNFGALPACDDDADFEQGPIALEPDFAEFPEDGEEPEEGDEADDDSLGSSLMDIPTNWSSAAADGLFSRC